MKTTLGIIIGNRGFFPTHLCKDGREKILSVLAKAGFNTILLGEDDSPYGSVESIDQARKCAALFDAHRHEIDGILVTLPNFGDERAIANTLRWANLNVPVLIHAFPDESKQMTISHRRDSFCGKMSVCNNLRQYGINFTLTTRHTSCAVSPEFAEDLKQFGATCRIVKGFRNARVGAIGARPAAFNTVRFSEKLLERAGISVEVLDMYELFGNVQKRRDDDPLVIAKLREITSYVSVQGIPVESLLKMARMGVEIDLWMQKNQLIGSAIQCWTALEEFFGIVPCTLMSMSSNSLIPSACEVDITGMCGMLALQFASGKASAIVDWNNNFDNDPDKCVIFHCSNLPKDIFVEASMDYQAIIAGSVGKENSYGTIVGQIAPGPMSYCRVSTDDLAGKISCYVGEGQFTADKLNTFGGYGVIEVPQLQKLLNWCCRNGFEHHVAVNRGHYARGISDAFRYLGWECVSF
ncbi:MAG: L-fucose/L-arabinose isomerase family protein [Verrucomicrobiota bacterium]|nr:L-fucose/L-arabinose isomerase family protein [Verrucomicrobiota bacterium]